MSITSQKSSQSPSWREITAIFGGRFDPPHLGHQEVVHGLLENPGVKNVVLLVSGTPPHKKTLISSTHRNEMVKRAFANEIQNKTVLLDDREIKSQIASPQKPTYSADTLPSLSQDYGPIAFVVGSDQFAKISSWYRFPEVLTLCHWIVLERKNSPSQESEFLQTLDELTQTQVLKRLETHLYEVTLNQSRKKVLITSTPARSISSTQVREHIALTGKVPENTLNPNVMTYLMENQLYGTAS